MKAPVVEVHLSSGFTLTAPESPGCSRECVWSSLDGPPQGFAPVVPRDLPMLPNRRFSPNAHFRKGFDRLRWIQVWRYPESCSKVEENRVLVARKMEMEVVFPLLRAPSDRCIFQGFFDFLKIFLGRSIRSAIGRLRFQHQPCFDPLRRLSINEQPSRRVFQVPSAVRDEQVLPTLPSRTPSRPGSARPRGIVVRPT